jgi:hypothetical protein
MLLLFVELVDATVCVTHGAETFTAESHVKIREKCEGDKETCLVYGKDNYTLSSMLPTS